MFREWKPNAEGVEERIAKYLALANKGALDSRKRTAEYFAAEKRKQLIAEKRSQPLSVDSFEEIVHFPRTAVVALIRSGERFLVVERREHRAVYGGWKTIGVFGKLEPRIVEDGDYVKMFSSPLLTSLEEVADEVRIGVQNISRYKEIGILVDLPLGCGKAGGYVNYIYEFWLKDGARIDCSEINRRELADADLLTPKEILDNFREYTPAALATLEMACLGCCKEIDIPYVLFRSSVMGIPNYKKEIPAIVVYPEIFCDTRPDVVRRLSMDELFRESVKTAENLLEIK